MKTFVSSITFIIIIAVSGLSHGGGNVSYSIGYGFGNGHGYGHGYGHSYRYNSPRYSGYRNYGHRGYGYGNHGSLSFGYGHRYGHSSDYVAGALILGGLIGYGINSLYQRSYDRNYYRKRYYRSYNDGYWGNRDSGYTTTGYTTVYNQPAPVTVPVRRLHRDRNGNCFEIKTNNSNEELRITLDRSECNW